MPSLSPVQLAAIRGLRGRFRSAADQWGPLRCVLIHQEGESLDLTLAPPAFAREWDMERKRGGRPERSQQARELSFLKTWAAKPPAFYYSQLGDLFMASVWAVDLLTLRQQAPAPGKSAVKGLADQGAVDAEGFAPPPQVTEQPAGERDRSLNTPSKPSWTRKKATKSITGYFEARKQDYDRLRERIHAGDQGAIREARKLFGRNAIVRALGIRSPKMVSDSTAWRRRARELRLMTNGPVAAAAPPFKKIGQEIAEEQAGLAYAEQHDPAAIAERSEREETLRRIREFADGLPDTARGKQLKVEVEAIFHKYDAGEMTDEQARRNVDLLREPDRHRDRVTEGGP